MGRKIDECCKAVSSNYFFDHRLKKLGMRNDMVGYYFIIEIMNVLINEGRVIHSFSKELYPEIASKFNRKETSIERDIRSCINNQWNGVLKDKLKKFWTKSTQPTCRQFIFILKNYIMWQIA